MTLCRIAQRLHIGSASFVSHLLGRTDVRLAEKNERERRKSNQKPPTTLRVPWSFTQTV
jgi:hypothetical protein